MISFANIIPYLFSFLIGYFTIGLILNKEENLLAPIQHIISLGTGLGISANICFLSLILFDTLVPFFVLSLNSILLITLGFFYFKENPLSSLLKSINFQRSLIYLGLLTGVIILSIPLIKHALFYAHGGWDAWSVWNVKAKFIYLGGSSWHNMFQPVLWRSSPHYPLLLPLINVWGWIFTKTPVFYIPQWTTILFTFMVTGLLFWGLYDLTKSQWSVIPVLVMISTPFVIKQCISQYCDLVFGFYLLGSIYCLIKSSREGSTRFAVIAGILLGLLTFTKGEGLLAAGLVVILSAPYLWLTCPRNKRIDILISFYFVGLIASTPLLYFKYFYAPDNVTFTNGLTSTTHPSTFMRLKAILFYYLIELKSPKWNGLLLAIAATLLLNIQKLIKKESLFIALFLFAYFSIITFYYYTNTQFEIIWWLKSTLGRVIFAVLPIILFLTFLTFLQKKDTSQ